MADWHARFDRARAHVDSGWTADRAEAGLHGAIGKRRRRALAKAAAVSVAALALAVVLVPRLVPRPAPDPEATFGQLDYLDGSRAALMTRETRVAIERQSATEVVSTLDRGVARFDVSHEPGRVFRIRAGTATVTVLGTFFTLDKKADALGVTVHRGRVRIESVDGVRELGAGEQGTFALAEPEVVAKEPAVMPTAPPKHVSWQALARRDAYDDAYQALKPSDVRDVAEELMLAADVARKSLHASEAVPYLERMIKKHPKDARAPLAALTLGKVQLELDEPERAARAFADVRRLSPQHPLAEDALAHEVEAWRKAGDSQRARERADEYLRLYPDGQWRQSVR